MVFCVFFCAYHLDLLFPPSFSVVLCPVSVYVSLLSGLVSQGEYFVPTCIMLKTFETDEHNFASCSPHHMIMRLFVLVQEDVFNHQVLPYYMFHDALLFAMAMLFACFRPFSCHVSHDKDRNAMCSLVAHVLCSQCDGRAECEHMRLSTSRSHTVLVVSQFAGSNMCIRFRNPVHVLSAGTMTTPTHVRSLLVRSAVCTYLALPNDAVGLPYVLCLEAVLS